MEEVFKGRQIQQPSQAQWISVDSHHSMSSILYDKISIYNVLAK